MGNQVSYQPLKTQKDFDPVKYQGEWQEIAKYPLFWEKDCATAQADYKWDEDSQILFVENRCLDENLVPFRARYGEAKVIDPKDKSKLMLEFTDGLPSGPASEYYVLSSDYVNYTIVGEPTRQFLWVMTREPYLDPNDIPYIKMVVKRFGYDPEKLIFSEARIKR